MNAAVYLAVARNRAKYSGFDKEMNAADFDALVERLSHDHQLRAEADLVASLVSDDRDFHADVPAAQFDGGYPLGKRGW